LADGLTEHIQQFDQVISCSRETDREVIGGRDRIDRDDAGCGALRNGQDGRIERCPELGFMISPNYQ